MNVEQRVEAVSRQLGMRIRAARKARAITLDGLSEQTALSAGFLSRLERGETNASISNLIVIADRLGIPLRDFFEGPGQEPQPEFVVSRASERNAAAAMEGKGYTYRLTSGVLADQQMSAFELTYLPGEAMHGESLSHKGEEVLYLLEGQLEFEINGQVAVLDAGDCVHFNCEKPHRGRNIGKTPARLLMVVTPVDSLTP
ncbi:cupin domain-containing protein [Cupriavidus pampae]|uniref:HTH-type transcriptional regulator PuuR n=1 Tax=Cupriavidus pampae TaxID=659251 RepID=A0ABN7Y3V3_9BURK|nr:cupin domain-containing protein [Cupriavidus pampae]CAG9166635.1 HTH-type transcriptional regulator PuuR [Cupriavidus pampae]